MLNSPPQADSDPAPAASYLPHYSSLRDQVLRVIRTGLVTGRFKPGEMYSATVMADELRVSKSPVREALLTLANQGIMEAVRNRGFRVITMSEHDLEEVYQLRLMLEIPGMRKVAEQHSASGDLAPFHTLVEQNRAAAEEGDVHAFLDTDARFHLGLLGLTGNRRLAETVDSLRLQARLYGVTGLAKQHQLARYADEHAQILTAITAGTPDTTERLMRHHLSHTRGAWAGDGSAERTDTNS